MSTNIAALVTDNLDIWTTAIERKPGVGRGNGKKLNLYGIERLRALILYLAVRGKLVPQNAADEPAAISLKRLGVRTVESNDLTLNAGWAQAKLSDLGSFVGGMTPSKGVARYWGAGHPWISPKDMGDDQLAESEDQVTEAALRETSLQMVPAGSLVMVARSGILRRTFPVAINTMPCTLNQDMKALILHPEVNARYLQVMLQGFQPRVLSQLVKRGMTVESLIFKEFTEALWPLPPLAEQLRIVVKVDELMALCDALEERSASALTAHQTLVETVLATLVNGADATDFATNWARLESHFDTLFTTEASIDALKQTIFELAVRGMLVRQRADEKPLQRPNAKWGNPVAAPFPIPLNWQCLPLGALGELRGGGTPSKTRSDYWDGLLPWVSPKDMKQDYLSDAQLHVSESALTSSAIKLIPASSILFVVRGMILAHSFPVGIAKADLTINQDMKAIILHVPAMNEYLLRALKGLKREMLMRVERSSHGTCRLDSKNYARLPVPIPPLAEQHRIVAKVDELTALCDKLKASLFDVAGTQKQIADAIVKRAAA
ncbi:type I restriction endonuclease subunit S [Rhizobium laguerreae]|uniref:restriction endonuclease subunit S n=1 Tax=Rhizobium laguerreae TaxID=1076926 RepID=UPI001C9210EB|nr:restriction endonuclease subunit S [Rhizobium laguerreae]MBY3414845.1 type I restriction endonuclease subunit S [Rhizobium laguerreae]